MPLTMMPVIAGGAPMPVPNIHKNAQDIALVDQRVIAVERSLGEMNVSLKVFATELNAIRTQLLVRSAVERLVQRSVTAGVGFIGVLAGLFFKH